MFEIYELGFHESWVICPIKCDDPAMFFVAILLGWPGARAT